MLSGSMMFLKITTELHTYPKIFEGDLFIWFLFIFLLQKVYKIFLHLEDISKIVMLLAADICGLSHTCPHADSHKKV